jgi:hypothetical protein
MTIYKWRDKGDDVVLLQTSLIQRGFSLPKYGADGDLGGETWARVEAFAGVDQFQTSKPLPQEVTDDILADVVGRQTPSGYVRVNGEPSNIKGWRSWAQIDTIMIHQTGIWMTDTPERMIPVNAHMCILKNHATPIVQMQPLNAYIYHGNEANKFSIGIEINGHFPGLIKKYNPDRHSSEGPSESQVQDCRETILWIMDEVDDHGGNITTILPHRVSNDVKQSDPGEAAWRDIGLWAQTDLGLCDGGPGYCIGDGFPIPHEWDPRPAYAAHSYYP